MDENSHIEDEADFPLQKVPHPPAPSTTTHRDRPALDAAVLRCVKLNDVDGLKAAASAGQLRDPTACDELGRTAMVVAIDRGNSDVVKCLLDLQYDVGDALFHAIAIRSVQAVRTICNNLHESVKLEVMNCFSTDVNQPGLITPLLLAGKSNHFQILKILLDYGAKLPVLEELISKAGDDSYLKFIATLHWYETASSEAYVILTSQDPLNTIFELGKSLQETVESLNVPLFVNDCGRIQEKLAALSTKLLSLTRDNNEIGVVLRGGVVKPFEPSVPLRIQQALEIDSFMSFVSHPSCQDYLSLQWEVRPQDFLKAFPRLAKSNLIYILIMLLYPVICVAYILLPGNTLHFMTRPKIRFLVHLASRLCLLILLISSTKAQIVDLLVWSASSQVTVSDEWIINYYIYFMAHPVNVVYTIICIWILGMTCRAIRKISKQGIVFFVKDRWNWMDLPQLILYWIFLMVGFMSYLKAKRITDEDGMQTNKSEGTNMTLEYDRTNGTQYGWQELDVKLLSEAAFALANVLSFLQIFHHLTVLAFLGPLLISFGGMVYDVLKFFLIFGFVWVSFSIGLTQLYHKFNALDLKSCSMENGDCQPETPFISFSQSMSTLFWSLFGMTDLSNLKLYGDVGITETIGTALYACFMMIGPIVLLNALIAMMSSTFARVEQNSTIEWKIAATRVKVGYIKDNAIIPPPFNLVPTVRSMVWLYKRIRNKCINRETHRLKQSCRKQQNELDTYKALSRSLGERCLRAMYLDTEQATDPDDFSVLRNSLDKLSSDMSEVQSNLRCIMNALNSIGDFKEAEKSVDDS